MSLDDLTAFFTRLQEDPTLQDKARAVAGSDEDRAAALCNLAADEGFAITPEDLRSEQAAPAIAALDDESLKQVVGGLFCNAPGFTSPSPGPGEDAQLL